MVNEPVLNTNDTEDFDVEVYDPLVSLIDEFKGARNVFFCTPNGEEYVTLGIRGNMNEGNLLSKAGIMPYDGIERDIILNKGAFSWTWLSCLAGVKDLDNVDYEIISETDKIKKICIVKVNEQGDRRLLLEADIYKVCGDLSSFDESDDAALYNSMVGATNKDFTYVCFDNNNRIVFGINMSNYEMPEKFKSITAFNNEVDDDMIYDLPCFVYDLNSHEIDFGIMDGLSGKYIEFISTVTKAISTENSRILRHKARECLKSYNDFNDNIQGIID